MKFFIIVLGLTLGAAAYFFAQVDPSQIYIYLVDSETNELTFDRNMPFLLFAIGLVVAVIVLYLVLSYVESLIRAPRKLREWQEKRNSEVAQTHTMKGFAKLIEGDWEKAENDLLTKIPHNKTALINYLGLAYSAQQRGLNNRRDIYIKEAMRRYPKQQNAIDLTHARLQYQAGQYDKAQEKLEKLLNDAPKNKAALRLLTDVYEKTENYDALMQALPKAKKLKALPDSEQAQKEHLAYQNVLANPALTVDEQGAVEDAWQALPRKAKKNAGAVYAHAQALLADNKAAEAEKLVRKSLNREYDHELALLYGAINTEFTSDQIKLAQSWLKKTPESDELKFTLARLHRRNENVDEAQSLLQQLISDDSYLRTDACSELGELLEQIGEKDAALLCYKNGLNGSSQSTAAQLSHANDAKDDEDNDAITVPVLDSPDQENGDDTGTESEKK